MCYPIIRFKNQGDIRTGRLLQNSILGARIFWPPATHSHALDIDIDIDSDPKPCIMVILPNPCGRALPARCEASQFGA